MVFSFDEQVTSDAAPTIKTTVECERCGKTITGAVLPDGTKMAAHEIVGQSKIKFDGTYCLECQEALEGAKPKKEPMQPKMATQEQKDYIRQHATDVDYLKIMQKYGADLENLTAGMATRVIKQVDANNKKAD